MNKLLLRVLVIDDSEDDTLLLERALKQGEWDIHLTRVDSHDRMQHALETQVWDVVVSDFMMPSFGGMQALQLFNRYHLNIPFILTSGKISEEMAIEALQAGAQDFVLKQNTARLLPAIKRGIERAHILAEQRQAQTALIQSETLFHTLAAVAPIGIIRTDAQGKVLYRNDTWRNMRGTPEQDIDTAIELRSRICPDDLTKLQAEIEKLRQDHRHRIAQEVCLHKPDGTKFGFWHKLLP